jgi:hypothetical protein
MTGTIYQKRGVKRGLDTPEKYSSPSLSKERGK